MGACKAPISHLHGPPPPPTNPNTITKRLFLLCFPVCAATTTLTLPSSSTPHRNATTENTSVQAKSSSSLALAAESFDLVSQAEKDASLALSKRVSEAIELLDKGREFQAIGDFNQALLCFTTVVENYKEFAFSEYARVGRALALYEVGDRDEAIAEMEDVSISLKGYPEVHAALAAALYVDKHAPLLAENQFTIATLLDPHYTDLSYVKETKHWPPSLVSSLQHFITLS